VAIECFTDNVVIPVIKRHLLGPDRPVKSLSPDMIADLDDSDHMDSVGGNFPTSSTRDEPMVRLDRFCRAFGNGTESSDLEFDERWRQ
jgi:hypothetical protein